MKATIPIPRFLLPQRSSIWRAPALQSAHYPPAIRNASHKATSKAAPAPKAKGSLVLEKPAKFNPPSHGARLPKAQLPRHYGAPLSDAQKEVQRKKKYPNMMPSQGTFLHWFLNNRSIHLYITLGTLFSLAGYTTITHFKHTSNYADMLPPASDLFFHPISFVSTTLQVLKLHSAEKSEESAESRRRKVDDVAKRKAYRKAHGIEDGAFVTWLKGPDDEKVEAVTSPGLDDGSPINPAEVEGVVDQVLPPPPKKPLKMWLGIW